jgi:hypothetical protein
MISVPPGKKHVLVGFSKEKYKIIIITGWVVQRASQPWVLGSKNLLLPVLPPAVAVVDRRIAASGRAHPHLILPLLHHLPAHHMI